MWGLSISHWIIVVGVIVLLFGSSRIPVMMKDIGQSIRNLHKIKDEIEKD